MPGVCLHFMPLIPSEAARSPPPGSPRPHELRCRSSQSSPPPSSSGGAEWLGLASGCPRRTLQCSLPIPACCHELFVWPQLPDEAGTGRAAGTHPPSPYRYIGQHGSVCVCVCVWEGGKRLACVAGWESAAPAAISGTQLLGGHWESHHGWSPPRGCSLPPQLRDVSAPQAAGTPLSPFIGGWQAAAVPSPLLGGPRGAGGPRPPHLTASPRQNSRCAMDSMFEDDISILTPEALGPDEDWLDSPNTDLSGEMCSASHFALITAYDDIKNRLSGLERENSTLKRRLKMYEVKVRASG